MTPPCVDALHVLLLDCLLACTLLLIPWVACLPAGRHPLAELLVEGSYIPNDTTMAQGKPSVHVITGPNASGKSCYTKQVRSGGLWCLGT
jgi:hypothetical protein